MINTEVTVSGTGVIMAEIGMTTYLQWLEQSAEFSDPFLSSLGTFEDVHPYSHVVLPLPLNHGHAVEDLHEGELLTTSYSWILL